MASDMVERLRDQSQAIWHSHGPMLRQAANEINKLRAELAEAKGACSHIWSVAARSQKTGEIVSPDWLCTVTHRIHARTAGGSADE